MRLCISVYFHLNTILCLSFSDGIFISAEWTSLGIQRIHEILGNEVLSQVGYVYDEKLKNNIWEKHFSIGGDCKFRLNQKDYVNLLNVSDSSEDKDAILNVTTDGNGTLHNHGVIVMNDQNAENAYRFFPYSIKRVLDLLTFSINYVQEEHKEIEAVKKKIPRIEGCEARNERSSLAYDVHTHPYFIQLVVMLQLHPDNAVCSYRKSMKTGTQVHIHRVWLDLCCRSSVKNIREMKDSKKEWSGNVTSVTSYVCYKPDSFRDYVTVSSLILSIVFTLFSPLMLNCIPNKPWRRRRVIDLTLKADRRDDDDALGNEDNTSRRDVDRRLVYEILRDM